MLSDTKFEKITLYTATQKLGTKHPTSALDYILSCLDNNMEAECKIIESDSEPYVLTPASKQE
jgi:hypothetical protein